MDSNVSPKWHNSGITPTNWENNGVTAIGWENCSMNAACNTYDQNFGQQSVVEPVQQPDSVDSSNLQAVFPYLYELQKQKGKTYGRSYCRHGDLSVFFNLERKWDRLANMMSDAMTNGLEDLMNSGTSSESFLDTVVDLANYSLLWVGYIYESHPELFKQFIQKNNLPECKPYVHNSM